MSDRKIYISLPVTSLVFCLVCTFFLSACSSKKAGTQKNLDRPVILKQSDFIKQRNVGGNYKVSRPGSGSYAASGKKVAIIDFEDKRYGKPFLIYQGKKIKLQGKNAGELVQTELVSALSSQGVRFSDESPVVLSGSVKKWVARANDHASPLIDAEAVVDIKIENTLTKRVYRGSYQGFANLKSRFMEEANMIKTANVAMKEALEQMLADKDFQKAIYQ